MQLNNPIVITTTVAAPVEKVWDCWTQPEHITQWNFASPEWHCPKATNDLWVGGRFSSFMEARDSSAGFDFEGTYTEVVPHSIISYVMDDGRNVHTQFEANGNSTQITTSFEPEQTHSPELQQQGWQAILNQFKQHVEEKG